MPSETCTYLNQTSAERPQGATAQLAFPVRIWLLGTRNPSWARCLDWQFRLLGVRSASRNILQLFTLHSKSQCEVTWAQGEWNGINWGPWDVFKIFRKKLCPHLIGVGTMSGHQKDSCYAMLSHFSRVRLCVTPQTAAHQAPPSLGFSRQEHWSGQKDS